MGKIRVASAMTNSMENTESHGLHRDAHFDSDRTLPEAGDEESGTIGKFEQAPDSSRSRGYGRYEI
jgi:hypothetical protein